MKGGADQLCSISPVLLLSVPEAVCSIVKGGADQLCSQTSVLLIAVPEAVCSMVKGGADQLCSQTSVLLIAVPEAVLSHTKARSRSDVQSILCVASRCPRGSLVPYKSEENQFHPVLALLRPGAPMNQSSNTGKAALSLFQGYSWR